MKYLKFLVLLQGLMFSLQSGITSKEGVIPSYEPRSGIMRAFLPFNANILIVGENVADLGLSIALQSECCNVFCCTSSEKELARLRTNQEELSNLYSWFGFLHNRELPSCSYFETKPNMQLYNEGVYQGNYVVSGSILPPIDSSLPFLFGRKSFVPTFRLSQLCKAYDLKKIHMFHLDCGGNELKVIQDNFGLINDSIVVFTKTYHKPIRKNITKFESLNCLMNNLDFVLLTHHIFDDLQGEALYVKRKYFNAVFKSKEI